MTGSIDHREASSSYRAGSASDRPSQ